MPLSGLDATSKAGGGNTVGGAVKNVTAPPSGSALGNKVADASSSIATGVVSGVTRAGVSAVDRLVGGTENRQLIQSAAGGVVSGAKDLLAGKQGLGSLVSGVSSGASSVAGGLIQGIQRAGLSSIDQLVGGTENRLLIQDAAGKTIQGAKDLLSGKETLSSLFSGTKADAGDVAGMCLGEIGGEALTDFLSSFTQGEGSDWGYLSRHYIARIYACDADGIALPSEILGVTGPVTDLNFEGTLNWQSPFESTGPESKAPALMAMLQSGAAVPVINALQAVNPIDNSTINGFLNGAANKAKNVARELEGRTGITKLNSRQVFSGMPPIKLTMTMYFRATTDAVTEVVEPYQRLLEFAMPQGLAADGVLTELITSSGSENSSFLKAMFPSVAPLMVGFTYGNQIYPAMVIESISNPLDGPMTDKGVPLYRAVQLSLATLTALDRADIKRLFV